MRKDRVVQFRCSQAEFDAFHAAAKANGMSISELILSQIDLSYLSLPLSGKSSYPSVSTTVSTKQTFERPPVVQVATPTENSELLRQNVKRSYKPQPHPDKPKCQCKACCAWRRESGR